MMFLFILARRLIQAILRLIQDLHVSHYYEYYYALQYFVQVVIITMR
jgi:hypothetical protein